MSVKENMDWFRDLKWGAFTHYLASDEMSPDEWNQQVDSFDVDGLAEQLAAAGAPYYFMTLGQNSGHFCSPNETYDSIVGITPSKCSRRDLIADLYDVLSERGIELFVYLPSGAPDRDPVACEKLEWHVNPQSDGIRPVHGLDDDGRPWGSKNERLASFQIKWEAIIAEWSKRWGEKVRGWWFDGCYFADAMYRHADAPNFASFAAAAKAGNPGSIVAFNPGVRVPVVSHTEHEDYTAGEISRGLPEVNDRWVDGAQLHILSYLGRSWCRSPVRFSDELAVAYTKYVNSAGGVITWDVPILKTGLIPDEFVKQLTVLGRALE